MTAPGAPQVREADDPSDPVAELYFEFVEQLMAGRQPDLQACLAKARDGSNGRSTVARASVEAAYAMALELVDTRAPARPMLDEYEIERDLGRGSMGQVFLARQVKLDRMVALKVLPPGAALSKRSRQRFLDEAQALAKLKHDNVVAVHDVIQQDGVLAYAMEWVEGMSVRAALDCLRDDDRGASQDSTRAAVSAQLATMVGVSGESIDRQDSLRYFAQLGVTIGRALHVVHEAGLVHRDVKPSNILIRRDGTPLLADFGLARGIDSDLTMTGTFVGTPIYAPIEQLQPTPDAEVDRRADVYALCVTLYEAVAGVSPFEASTTSAVLERVEAGSVPRLRKVARHAPRDLETILAKGMARDRTDRYATAQDLADDLERLLLLQPIHARPAGPVRRLQGVVRRNRRSITAAALGAVLVAVALLPLLLGTDAAAGAAAAKARSRDLLRQARVQLLSPEHWHRVWRVSSLGQPIAGSSLDELRAAGDAYREALRAWPNSPGARLEGATVEVVMGLLSGQSVGSFAAHLAQLPAASQQLVHRLQRQLVRSPTSPGLDSELDLTAVAENERVNIGLIAYLIGDYRLCESAWVTLDPLHPDSAFCNAALSILYKIDGWPARAYPRLFQALTSYPEADFLFVELADVALRMGDVELAAQWLRRSQHKDDYRHRAVFAQLAYARGRVEVAFAELARLRVAAPDLPTALHLEARIALAAGNAEQALERFRNLVTRWPTAAVYRLDLARLALRSNRPRVYLGQVRHVLGEDFGRQRSPGTVRDLLEILRIGGLRQLYRQGLRRTGSRGNRMGVPPLDQALVRRFERLGPELFMMLLEVQGRFDRSRLSLGVPANGTAATAAARYLSALVRGIGHAPPGLVTALDWRSGLALRTGAELAAIHWPWVTEVLLPRVLPVRTGDTKATTAGRGWRRRRVATGPPPHTDHVMASTHEGVLLFGGSTGRGALRGETWRWDGTQWTRLTGQDPAARMRHAAAYDRQRRRVVMFGGSTSSVVGFFKDTWEFDGTTWHRLDLPVHPSARNDHAMTYDPLRQRVVLVGGRDASGLRDDAWVFDGTTWQELEFANRPPARRDHCLGWDPLRRGVVVAGGFAAREHLRDTWVLGDAGWSCIGDSLPAPAGAAMAYSPAHDRLIRFGGNENGGRRVLVLDRDGWRESPEDDLPQARSGHAMVHDFARNCVVLFGGWLTGPLADHWEYR